MKRIPELDAIRGLAVVAVVCYHAAVEVAFVGWVGVEAFFVLSGYLITTIIVHGCTREGFLPRFYCKRALRIFPVYYLTLALVVAANRWGGHPWSWSGLAYNMVFLQNTPLYWGGEIPTFLSTFGPSWSVAIEEQFYWLWPLALMAAGPRRIPWLAAGLLALSALGRMTFGDEPAVLFNRGDGLAVGVWLAWYLDRPGNKTAVLATIGGLGFAFAMVYVIAC